MGKFNGAYHTDRDWLYQEYVVNERSTLDIGAYCGRTAGAIWLWLKKFGIATRSSSEASRLPSSRLKNSIKQSGPLNPFYGKHLSPSHKEKVSRGRTGITVKENAPGWKGGRRKASGGYVKIWAKGHLEADDKGYVYEHRLVAEETIGRPIGAEEVVHHINGIVSDNRPENLAVMTNHDHLKMHRALLESLPDAPDKEK